MDSADRIFGYRERVDNALERWLPAAATHPERFHTAIRYAVLGGGKRLRPLLVYATAEWLGLSPERLDGIAVAIELVHAYSLVHHDLPAMDGRDRRRGRAATHVAFDDATAILAGDALQAHAYYVLAADTGLAVPADIRRQLLVDLARASGSEGMAGGQAMELAASGAKMTAGIMEDVYSRKTGSLLRAAVIMPCRLDAKFGATRLAAADRYGRALGLAFQVAENLFASEPAEDALSNRRRLEELRAEALAALGDFGPEADALRWICDWAVSRER